MTFKKKAKIYPPRNSRLIFSFFSFLLRCPLSLILYTLYFILLLSLPGQNYYQILTLAYQKPLVRNLPFPYPTPAPYPLLINQKPKELTAQGVIVFDLPSGSILYEKNPNLPLMPASTTKIMTAVIALENYPLDQVLTVKNLVNLDNGSSMNLVLNDRLPVKSLLYGLLINSGNDAAFVLADNFNGNSKKFIELMNSKARSLKMTHTHFNNVSGLEETNHYTTVLDLGRLTIYALKNPTFAKIVSISTISVPNYNSSLWYPLKNVNRLLDEIPDVNGVKTGYTEEAGECLVASAKRGNRQILTVVLKSQDRFGETAYLIDWIFNHVFWQDSPY